MLRRCAASTKEFEIADSDLHFYRRLGVPPPTRCPEERQRRRLAWRNERKLHRRTCSATKKSLISIHHKEAPFPVVAQEYWWSDAWDPKSFGREIDFSRPFFSQYRELQCAVPRIAMLNGANDNSEFVNLSTWNKDSYLLFESDSNRECLYCDHSFFCVSSADLSYVTRSELCYHCLYCDSCYQGAYLENSENCSNSYFLKNCIGCAECFGCVNLRQKRHWIWNKPHTKDEYRTFIASLPLGSQKGIRQLRAQFDEHAKAFPVKYYEGRLNENVSGNYIWESKDCAFCFDIRKNRDCKWVCNCENSKDCYDVDVYGGVRGMELVYEGHSVGNGVFNCAFNTCLFEDVKDSYYCDFCHFSSHLFGCIGLRHAKHCILNKQHPEEEYHSLKQRVIEQMTADGEWGEFFPAALSPFSYNESVAQEYYPLAQEEAAAQGCSWHEEPGEIKGSFPNMPDLLADDLSPLATFSCTGCTRAFRLQGMEIEFHKKNGFLPSALCYECRYQERMKRRLPRKLYARTCAGSGEKVLSPYAPERRELVVSEREYEKASE